MPGYKAIHGNLTLHFVLATLFPLSPTPPKQQGGQGLNTPSAQRQLVYPGPEIQVACRNSLSWLLWEHQLMKRLIVDDAGGEERELSLFEERGLEQPKSG